MKLLMMMLKSLRLRCPHCGSGALTRYFWVFHDDCGKCGYTFQGETGDFWGGVVFSYAFAGIVGMFTGAMLTVLGWLSIADRVYVSTGVGFVSILLCFPFAKSLWIHMLYYTRGKYDEYRPPSRSSED